MKWLRRLLKPRRDPHSLDPVRMMVKPETRAIEALERRRAAAAEYVPQNEFHRDRQQERAT